MHKKLAAITSLLLALLATAQVGEGQEATSFTLEACIEYAQQHSSELQRSIAQQQVRESNRRDAFGRLLPTLSVNTSAYINYGRGIDPKTNTYTNISSFRNNYGVESSLLLFDGFSSFFQLSSARYEERAGAWEQLRSQRQVRLSTVEAYYNLLYTQELRRIAQEQLLSSDNLRRQAAKQLELGMKAPVDQAEVEATHARHRAQLVQQSNQYELALLQLKAVMGYPAHAPLAVADTLVYGMVEPTLLRADDLYSSALHTLPEAAIAEAQLKSSQSRYRGSMGAFAPRLNLFAGFSTGFSYYMDGSPYESFATQMQNRRGGYVGVSLSFDLFDGMRKVATLQRARAEYYQQQSLSDDARRDLYKGIQEAILNLNAAVEEYRATAESAQHLKQVYDTTVRNFQIGNASAIDLSLASSRYLEARNEAARKYTLYLLRQEWLKYYSNTL